MVDKNKCRGGIDLFIIFVCREKKKKKKEKKRDVYGKRKKKKCEKKWINVPFPMI